MDDVAIQVQNLSKQYKISRVQRRNDTLRDSIAAGFHASLSWLHRNPRELVGEDSIWALKDVSFEVRRGEVLGIIGRNGAGKSTLLKILSRITEPTHGRATIRGRVGSLLEVGTGFHPELSGRENIYLNGAILGMKRAEIDRKFDEIVAFAETEKFLDTPVKHYSSGMYVRLGFSVAAHLEPDILLVDEVLAVGDVRFWRKCMEKIRQLRDAGMTIFLVTHDMGHVQTTCNRAICLEDGSIVANGNPFDVISVYRKLTADRKIDGPGRPDRSLIGSLQASSRQSSLRLLSAKIIPGESWTEDGKTLPGTGMQLITRVAAADAKSFTMYVRVTSPDGFPYFTVRSGPIGVAEDNAELVISVQVPKLMLLPGEYVTWIGVSRSEDEKAVLSEEHIPFSIVAPRSAGEQFGPGVFENRAYWKVVDEKPGGFSK